MMHVGTLVIQVGVLEHETVNGDARAWPEAIGRLIERELAGWRQRNPTRVVTCTREFVIGRQCVLELDHVDASAVPRAGQQCSLELEP